MLNKSDILYFDKYITNIADTHSKAFTDYMKAANIELIKEVHPYAITPPKKEGGRWQTYVKDSSKKSGRKELKAQTEENLFSLLADYYFIGDKFGDVYYSWINHIAGYGKSGETLQRYEQRYKKYLMNSKIPDMPVKGLNLLALETECNQIVSKFNLTYHEWQQIKTLLLGTFKYAIKKRLISENPMDKIDIDVQYRQATKKASETQVYQTDEYDEIMEYLETKFCETRDDSFLAIKLGFMTGLRVGELAALQFGDINETQKQLHIVREEIRHKTNDNGVWKSSCIVVPHTKTYSDRYVSLLPKALDVIKLLKEKHPDYADSDYLFTRNGNRLRERQLAYVLEKFSERKGRCTKSTHKMRKTYASRLNATGVPIEHIRVELGHRYLTSTMNYIYNPLTDEETYKLMAKAM